MSKLKFRAKKLQNKTSNGKNYVDYIENKVIENGGIIFDPDKGNIHINGDFLELPIDITEIASHDLGNTLNAFTQQKIYLRTVIMRFELMAENSKRKFYAVSENSFAALTSKRMSESAKERILSTDEKIKPIYEEYTDNCYTLSYMKTILANIEDCIFLISREISRRSSDYTDENRVYNVQNRRG